MLNLYGKSNKLQDMEKLGNFMLKKYKDVENMWIEVGNAYFAVGKVESARLVLQRALTILSKKQRKLINMNYFSCSYRKMIQCNIDVMYVLVVRHDKNSRFCNAMLIRNYNIVNSYDKCTK